MRGDIFVKYAINIFLGYTSEYVSNSNVSKINSIYFKLRISHQIFSKIAICLKLLTNPSFEGKKTKPHA